MGRYAKQGITKEQLKERIESAGGVESVLYTSRVTNDLKKIEFDLENWLEPDDEEGFDMPGFEYGYDTLPNGVAVLWSAAGGDWESPVAFCIYIGDDNAIRAYVPKSGNCYNLTTKKAFGNDDEEQAAEDEMEKLEVEYEFDMDALRKDAANRIAFRN